MCLQVRQGPPLVAARTDRSVRDYRTGLLPRSVASVEAHVWEGMHHAGW